MAKTQTTRRSSDIVSELLKSAKGDTIPYRQALELLARQIPYDEALVIATLPRGSTQIVQPARVPEALLKEYSREFHLHDRLTWRTVLSRKPTTPADAWKDPNQSRYMRDFLRAHGLVYAIAAPLRAPVLEGYPGAIHLYRAADQGPFSASEISKLASFARQLDTAIERVRSARPLSPACTVDVSLTTRPKVRQFLFDGQIRELYAGEEFISLDPRLKEQMIDYARREVPKVNGDSADRVKFPDSRGDLWTFRVVRYRQYPAVGDGPFVLFCMQPNCAEWGSVRPSDFQADAELSRLIPAIKFMKQEFRRGPTLVEIAKTVHLSPFHFHRRFTELLGLTPKHYLLECQIQDAKAALLARKKELAQIAADCGFAHQSHFTSRFKQATGLTPTRWRRAAIEVRRGN